VNELVLRQHGKGSALLMRDRNQAQIL